MAAAAATLVLAGCAGGSADAVEEVAPSPTEEEGGDVSGTVAVEADWLANVQGGNTDEGGTCVVEAGYDDHTAGAPVVVTDASGSTVALGELVAEGLQVLTGSTDMRDTWCGFRFEVTDVPRGEGFYGVSVGDRDAVQFTEDEVFGDDLALSLGDIPGG